MEDLDTYPANDAPLLPIPTTSPPTPSTAKSHFAYAMIVPPFLGQQVVQSVEGLADDKGYVPVHDTYQSVAYANVYAVGRHGALDHRGVGRRAQDRLPHRGPSVPLRRS